MIEIVLMLTVVPLAAVGYIAVMFTITMLFAGACAASEKMSRRGATD